ncbi:MAG: ATP-dependent DNA helicase RecG [Promicromonosporaceae bacterium]|nr:ATP-dependent DNA helicase RecG [Promicromonosporaceae bacterium]
MRLTVDRLAEPLPKVLGTATGKLLANLGLTTVADLLNHYPRRYAFHGAQTPIGELRIGEHVSVYGEVEQALLKPFTGGFRVEATISDGRHKMTLTFFAKKRHMAEFQQNKLVKGAEGVFSGVVGQFRGRLQLTHPDYLLVGAKVADRQSAEYEASKPIPIYPATAKFPTWKIGKCVRTVLDTLTEADVSDPLPPSVSAAKNLISRYDALERIHRPSTQLDIDAARNRLRFEEAFVLQAALAKRRALAAARPATARPAKPDGLLKRFDDALPFTLTAGQIEVGGEIGADLAQLHPMQRLLQGEVGSGKTVVSLRAMLQVVDAGGQAALLAPTEVLAAQHARTLRAMLGPLAEGGLLGGADDGTRVALLTGSLGAAAKREALDQAASGEAGIVIGTHALLSERVEFADLGLVVVDEQHRFGVEQRDALRAKGQTMPHLLVMTATPIPRTVAMTVFGDLEVSTLMEIPAGRSGISTVVVPAANEAWMQRIWSRVREEVDAGHRAYVVCPRINPNDEEQATDDADLLTDNLALDGRASPPLRAVLEVAEALRTTPALAGLSIEVLHGQLPPAEKDAVMARFADGRSQVLVSTTVIEVGVDVPEATVMVVFDADRFGLSQLHQLRGRVGRGASPGLCLLVSTAEPGTVAAQRVEVLATSNDGFVLAAKDLELRSEGDVLGAAQSGRTSGLRLLRVVKDAQIIEQARTLAVHTIEVDPGLRRHPTLAAAIDATLSGTQEEFLHRA